eukprot:1816105-Amphidinium_carterae.1
MGRPERAFPICHTIAATGPSLEESQEGDNLPLSYRDFYYLWIIFQSCHWLLQSLEAQSAVLM